MKLTGKSIGFAVTGSYCTLDKVMPQVKKLVDAGADVYPIVSPAIKNENSRFGNKEKWLNQLTQYTNKEIISTINESEPIGPKGYLDVVLVAPCTGNTLAKFANGIVDTSVLMAIKAQLRNMGPVVLAISTNDALGINAKNIGLLLAIKNVYFVPFGQDDPFKKKNSAMAHMDLIPETISEALEGHQIQPLLREYNSWKE